MTRDEIYALINAERERQDRKWGEQADHSPEKWLAILTEEVGETAEAILEHNRPNMIEELIQVAAVAVRWLELS